MSLRGKEATVCLYLDKYLKMKVRELLKNCDDHWLTNTVETFEVCQNTTTEDGRSVIIYPKMPISDILFKKDTIFYVPENVEQKNVTKYIKEINKECKGIKKKYNDYISLIDSNIHTLELLLDKSFQEMIE